MKLKQEHIKFLKQLIPDDGSIGSISYICPAKRSGACPSTHTLLASIEDNNEILLSFFQLSGRTIKRQEVTLEKSSQFTTCKLVEFAGYDEKRIDKNQYQTQGYIQWSTEKSQLNPKLSLLSEENALAAVELELDYAIKQFQKDQQLPGRV